MYEMKRSIFMMLVFFFDLTTYLLNWSGFLRPLLLRIMTNASWYTRQKHAVSTLSRILSGFKSQMDITWPSSQHGQKLQNASSDQKCEPLFAWIFVKFEKQVIWDLVSLIIN